MNDAACSAIDVFKLAFPYYHHTPSELTKLPNIPRVPLNVAVKLGIPEFTVALRPTI